MFNEFQLSINSTTSKHICIYIERLNVVAIWWKYNHDLKEDCV